MNADRLARWYRVLEYAAFGRTLERSRFEYLERLAGARKILVLGEGDGRTLERLLVAAPSAVIDVIELSGGMIERERERIGGDGRVRFLQGDARTVELPGTPYDGVVSFYFLDCFSVEEARGIVERVASAVVPCGLWLCADFAIPERGWRRLYARAWVGSMYGFFGLTTGLANRTLPDVEGVLRTAGLKNEARSEWRWGMVVAGLWRKACR